MTAHSLVLAAVSPQLAKLLGADAADPEGDSSADDGGKVIEDSNDDSGNTDGNAMQCIDSSACSSAHCQWHSMAIFHAADPDDGNDGDRGDDRLTMPTATMIQIVLASSTMFRATTQC